MLPLDWKTRLPFLLTRKWYGATQGAVPSYATAIYGSASVQLPLGKRQGSRTYARGAKAQKYQNTMTKNTQHFPCRSKIGRISAYHLHTIKNTAVSSLQRPTTRSQH